MKHFLLFTFLLLISSFSGCWHRNEIIEKEKLFKINGKIDNDAIENFIFKYYSCEKESSVIDTISVVNGTFTIEGIIPSGTIAIFCIDDMDVRFYLDPGEMRLYLKRDSLERSVLTGSQTQIDREALELQTKPLEDYLYKIETQISSEQIEQNKKFLISQKDSIDNLLEKIRIDFIMSNPASYYSIDVIYSLLFRGKQDWDALMSLLDSLSENVRASCSGKQAHNHILQRKKSTMSNVSSLEALDKDGALVKLSDFEGKYILIDFGASWCVPCIKGFPHLKELYAKYKDKGLVMISISIDREEDEQKWLNAIEENDITEWIHILSCKNKGENNICDLHETIPSPIPHYIVIDNSGNVIKHWRGFGDEVAGEQNEMFENIFEKKQLF